ncbi:MAG: hypothetical protein PHQ35_00940 [Phycisphaerae bacterium]|nr:hypothetical protein [Phycisphaerae bacterium]
MSYLQHYTAFQAQNQDKIGPKPHFNPLYHKLSALFVLEEMFFFWIIAAGLPLL